MQRRKLGVAVVWMVCLLGMVAVVWSRPPMGSSRGSSHPPLALAADREPQPVSETSDLSPESTSRLPEPSDLSPMLDSPLPLPAVASALPAAMANALPAQEWVREIKPYKLVLKFEGNRMWATFQGDLGDGMKAECQVAADYHLTKDSMVYGIITSGKTALTTSEIDDLMEADAAVKKFFDQPFSFRYRLDEDALTIKDFNIGQLGEEEEDYLKTLRTMIVGSYQLQQAASAR